MARSSRRNDRRHSTKATLFALFAAAPSAMAQSCISLAGSTTCSAFNASSISTNLTDLFPFLNYVSDVGTFDTQIQSYIATSYSQTRYQDEIGCSSVDLTNTTDLYARYTTSVLCNAIVQNSIDDCGLSLNQTHPLCADSCADFAMSEETIVSTPDLCGSPGDNAISQIRADFTNCALPADSLSGTCIEAVTNEPYDCGFSGNMQGLCSYCSESSVNSTDSCCYNSNAEGRCTNVALPTTTSMPPLFPSSTSSSSGASHGSSGLSGGQIAGIVVGSILGALILISMVICCCLYARKRSQRSNQGSVFNQPSPSRQGPAPAPMIYTSDGASMPPPIPGGRVARMSALEATSSSSGPNSSPLVAGGIGAYQRSSSDRYDDSPGSGNRLRAGALPKRNGSLSSGSALAVGEDPSSPHSGSNGEQFSSPEGVGSGQSEQLHFFKDYYSQDEIKPGDAVATLWAYQPRANDEFELERGDMLKVVGIWDDGWATGVKLSQRAEDYDGASHNPQRDSGMSNGSKRPGSSGVVDGEIKAFPLVCVCLPQHWRKTIEGESTEGGGSSRPPPSP